MNLQQMRYRDELVRLGFDRAYAEELARTSLKPHPDSKRSREARRRTLELRAARALKVAA